MCLVSWPVVIGLLSKTVFVCLVNISSRSALAKVTFIWTCVILLLHGYARLYLPYLFGEGGRVSSRLHVPIYDFGIAWIMTCFVCHVNLLVFLCLFHIAFPDHTQIVFWSV